MYYKKQTEILVSTVRSVAPATSASRGSTGFLRQAARNSFRAHTGRQRGVEFSCEVRLSSVSSEPLLIKFPETSDSVFYLFSLMFFQEVNPPETGKRGEKRKRMSEA